MQYKGEPSPVLKNITLDLPSRGLVAIVGKSGCGKSTLLHLLLGMLTPTSGDISYCGKNLKSFRKRDWLRFRRSEAAIVFQRYNLIEDLSALDNVALAGRITGQSALKARKNGLKLLKQFNLDNQCNKRARLLSGGEKQRVALCRALINQPRVVFADEPTGALDSTNSAVVMDALKEIARSRLVLLVSHNLELVKRYAELIIQLENGSKTVVYNRLNREDYTIENSVLGSIKYGNWIGKILRMNMKKNPFSVCLRFASSFLGFTAVLLSLGFSLGCEPALEAEKRNTLEYLSFKASSRTYIELASSPLRLIKEYRPKAEDVYDYFPEVEFSVHNDYEYFFPSYTQFELHGAKQEACKFLPLFDFDADFAKSFLVKETDYRSYRNSIPCYVNQLFISDYKAFVGDLIGLTYSSSFSYEGEKVNVPSQFRFQIIGIANEFSFLNTPKVYYPYQVIDRYYGEFELEGLPFVGGRKQTVSSFLSRLPENDPIANYSSYVFAKNVQDADRLIEIIASQDNEGVHLSSTPNDVASSFISLSSALITSLSLFLAISAFSLVMVVSLNAYSSYLKQKKESALLLALGARQSDIISLVSTEGVLVSLLSSCLALPFSYLLEKIVSDALYIHFGIHNLISIPFVSFLGIPFLLIPATLLAGMVVSYMSCWVPLKIAGRMDLAEALKEE